MTFRPDPKPTPDPKRERTPLVRSAMPPRKTPMRRGPLSRSAQMEREAPKRSQSAETKGRRRNWQNKTRRKTEAETAREYGPPGRRAFVRTLPCAACGIVGLSQNAHTRIGGTSIKADYLTIVPLCGDTTDRTGCHSKQEGRKPHFAEIALGMTPGSLERAAERVEALWQTRGEG